MANLSKNAELSFTLNNQSIDYPLNARDVQILATFDNEATQANITTESFEFTLEEAEKIRQYIIDGMNSGAGIFEGMPFDITTYNQSNQYLAFKGYLDLSDGFIDTETNVLCNIKKSNGLNSLDEKISALTFGYLESIGVISSSEYIDTKYIVYNKVELIEILIANIVLFLLIKETVQAIKDTAAAVATVVGLLTASFPPGLGAFIYAVAIAIIQSVYTTLLVIAIIDMMEKLINSLMPPLVPTKALKIRASMEKIAIKLGYVFISPIPELDTYVYLPSNPSTDEGLTSGLPQSSDYGYRVNDFFKLLQDLFNGRYAIVGNELHFRKESDPFFEQQSTWIAPDVKNDRVAYNTNEFQANRIIAFQTDLMDNWTINNFTGTNYEVITDANVVNNVEAKYLKGLDFVNIPLALGNRKNELTDLENILSSVASFADGLINTFGGSSDLEGQIEGKIGYLKVSQNDYSLPKLLTLVGDKLPANHRALLSAKYLYENYHISKSFVQNNYYGQKYVYNDIEIPFGFEDFLQLINNSYFTTSDGYSAKAIKIEWNILKDKAVLSYWIRKPYTTNLKETFIEP